jgi:hypothetical protein
MYKDCDFIWAESWGFATERVVLCFDFLLNNWPRVLCIGSGMGGGSSLFCFWADL